MLLKIGVAGTRQPAGPNGATVVISLARFAAGATLTLTGALLPRWRDAAANGHADDDLRGLPRELTREIMTKAEAS